MGCFGRNVKTTKANREKIMRTSTNVKYIKSALQALREMGEATAGEVAKKIGEDSGSVSGAFGGYRRRGLVKQVGWIDKSPIFIITDLGIGRIEIENGATSNRLKTMSAVYELFKNDSEISSQLISKIIGETRKRTTAMVLDCKKAGYLMGDNNGRLTTYEITAKGAEFLSKMTSNDVSSDVLKASEARLKAKAAPMHTMLNRIRTPQQLAAMGA